MSLQLNNSSLDLTNLLAPIKFILKAHCVGIPAISRRFGIGGIHNNRLVIEIICFSLNIIYIISIIIFCHLLHTLLWVFFKQTVSYIFIHIFYILLGCCGNWVLIYKVNVIWNVDMCWK